MSLAAPSFSAIDGSRFSVGVVAARFNATYVDPLLANVVSALEAASVARGNITVVRVPGSGEVPYAVQSLGRQQSLHCCIALGLIVRGGTPHYVVLAQSVADALQRVALETRTPVINGVMVVENEQQAEERCLGAIDRGAEFARAALEMARLKSTEHTR